ncbi:MAG: c-type cytochrome [Sphingobacteriales bacterium]|nr:MAG: c-type cytochrome [Sphingobacteriales bacterium]
MKKIGLLSIVAALSVLAYSCNKKEPATSNHSGTATTAKPNLPAATHKYFEQGLRTPLANEKATLGRVLFYDKQLSLNNAVACASCHRQEFAFSDNVQFSRGFENKQTGRNSMAIQNLFVTNRFNGGIIDPLQPNTGGNQSLFWDGRSTGLLDLVLRPVSNHIEMGIENVDVLPEKLARLDYYPALFKTAYGSEGITVQRIKESLVMFMAAIKSENTRFDAAEEGNGQLNALETQGHSLFFTKYNCNSCHQVTVDGYSGMSNPLMDIGLDSSYADKGLGTITGVPNDNGRFRIPNLRNVSLTGPYMHDGRFKTIEDVLNHYSKGISASKNLDERLKDDYGKPMRMNISKNEMTAIIAFLNTLTDSKMITDPMLSDPFKAN